MHGPRRRHPGMSPRMRELRDADPEQTTVVEDDRRARELILLSGFERYPVRGVVREEREPVVEPPAVEQRGLVVEEAFDLAHSGRIGHDSTSLTPVESLTRVEERSGFAGVLPSVALIGGPLRARPRAPRGPPCRGTRATPPA